MTGVRPVYLVPHNVLLDLSPSRLGLHRLLNDVVAVAAHDAVNFVVQIRLLILLLLVGIIQLGQLIALNLQLLIILL